MAAIGESNTKRTGWVLRGIKEPESVACHMYRMSIMAFLAGPELDKDRCIKMALVHDMAECIVGDIVPSDPISKEEKHRQERAAIDQLKTLISPETGNEMYTLWEEYERQESSEARFVKDLDRFDMILQAHEYEQSEQKPGYLQEFYDSTEGKFTTAAVSGWTKELYSERKETLANAGDPSAVKGENSQSVTASQDKFDCNSTNTPTNDKS